MIVDSHTHLLPARLAAAIRSFFRNSGMTEFEYAIEPRSVLDRHLADGIDTVWNLPYAHKPGMAAALNTAMLEVSDSLADHAVTVVPGCTVHPGDTDPTADFTTAVAAGARVLKLHCSVGGYPVDDPRLSGVLDAAGALRVPVVVHAGHDANGLTTPAELVPIGVAAARHRATTIVLAHFGHDAFEHAVALLDEHPNLVADLTPVVFGPVPITADVADRHAERILFGTDAPNTGLSAATLIGRLRATGASDAAVRAITSDNARRLLPSPA